MNIYFIFFAIFTFIVLAFIGVLAGIPLQIKNLERVLVKLKSRHPKSFRITNAAIEVRQENTALYITQNPKRSKSEIIFYSAKEHDFSIFAHLQGVQLNKSEQEDRILTGIDWFDKCYVISCESDAGIKSLLEDKRLLDIFLLLRDFPEFLCFEKIIKPSFLNKIVNDHSSLTRYFYRFNFDNSLEELLQQNYTELFKSIDLIDS